MKKIVGIIAALAMAGAVFAADVSATAKVSSTLFESADGAISLFKKLDNAETADYATLFSLQVSSDNAGGGVKYWGRKDVVVGIDDKGEAVKAEIVEFGSYNVWFKPTDSIKLSFRENGGGLFGDKYNGYYAHDVASYAAGYGISFALDAINIDFVIADSDFVNKPKDGDAVIGQFGTKISYGADFGSLAFIFKAENNFKAFDIGAGYSGNFDAVGVVFNAGAKISKKETVVGINPSAGGNVDAISWAIDVPVTLTLPKNGDTTTEVGLNAKAGYALDAATFTLRFESGNLLAKTFDATIGLAIEGNVGAASWKVDPNYNVGKKTFAVGFETGISF